MTGKPSDPGNTRRSVLASLAVNGAATIALGAATVATGSVALRAQTGANAADLAVVAFLLIGVLGNTRPADEGHPLGYGRECFFGPRGFILGVVEARTSGGR